MCSEAVITEWCPRPLDCKQNIRPIMRTGLVVGYRPANGEIVLATPSLRPVYARPGGATRLQKRPQSKERQLTSRRLARSLVSYPPVPHFTFLLQIIFSLGFGSLLLVVLVFLLPPPECVLQRHRHTRQGRLFRLCQSPSTIVRRAASLYMEPGTDWSPHGKLEIIE